MRCIDAYMRCIDACFCGGIHRQAQVRRGIRIPWFTPKWRREPGRAVRGGGYMHASVKIFADRCVVQMHLGICVLMFTSMKMEGGNLR
jgi:hypothetical protein